MKSRNVTIRLKATEHSFLTEERSCGFVIPIKQWNKIYLTLHLQSYLHCNKFENIELLADKRRTLPTIGGDSETLPGL